MGRVVMQNKFLDGLCRRIWGKIYNYDNKTKQKQYPLIVNKYVKGKMFNAESLAIAKGPGHGWMDYYWVKPGEKKASPKVAYIMSVPGKNMLIGAGVYDITKAEAEKAGK